MNTRSVSSVAFLDILFRTFGPGLVLCLLAVALVLALVFLFWPRKARLRKIVLLGLTGLAGIIAAFGALGAYGRAYRPGPLTFDGDSTGLARTRIVATLDTPVEAAKNVLWCGSFQLAWNELKDMIAKEPVEIADAETLYAALNAAPTPEIAEDEVFATAGLVGDGIRNSIRREMAQRFPGDDPPTFPDLAPEDIVAYAFLHARCKFTAPYYDYTEPLEFTDSAGMVSKIRTFGVWESHVRNLASGRLRKQAHVLYVKRGPEPEFETEEFAVDLCADSNPNQIVFAIVPFAGSLRQTLDYLDTQIPDDPSAFEPLESGEVLLVPDMAFRMAHRFAELEGKDFVNDSMKEYYVLFAKEDVLFRLDRSGAELVSKSMIGAKVASAPVPMSPARYVADRPFLIYMKKRDAARPYFAMWVDNDELLRKW